MGSDYKPLADRLRPEDISQFIGQEHLTGKDSLLRIIIDSGKPASLLFFGPPGSGKTTMAEILSSVYPLPVMRINGVNFSTQNFKKLINETKGEPILIIIDEIHRMNKLQQDALLPYIEKGNIYIIGTTTENPSFEVNNALLSRLTVLEFSKLSRDNIITIIDRALKSLDIDADENIKGDIADFSNYDARQAINIIENLGKDISGIKDTEQLKKLLNRKFIPHDKSGEEHYNLISAFHKSVRGSDVNASLFYLARMLSGGEDPLYVARRMIRIASEDIGNADPGALNLALNAYRTYEILGSPEGELALAQCAIYLALCPKSTAVYKAFGSAMKDAKAYSHEPVPLKFRNAVTDFDKDRDYGKDYRYPPDYSDSFIVEKYFPDKMPEREYYFPVQRGFERDMAKRLEYYLKLRKGEKPE